MNNTNLEKQLPLLYGIRPITHLRFFLLGKYYYFCKFTFARKMTNALAIAR